MPIALFTRLSDAEPLQKRLTENGIYSEIHVSRPATTVRLDVAANQFERAHQLLLDWDAKEGMLGQAIRCPECKSLRVEYPQYSRKSMLPNLFLGVMTMIGATEREFYCHDCHFTWPKEGRKASRLRPHMAPYYFIEGVEQTNLERSEVERSEAEHHPA